MSHHHHHGECCSSHHEGKCCCGANHHSCHDESCDKHGGESCQEDFAKELLGVADCAWMDVLKTKIKQHIEAHSGAELDKMAALIAETNAERWKNKLAKKKLKH